MQPAFDNVITGASFEEVISRPAFITACLATRKTLLRRRVKPAALAMTFLCRARAVTPRLTLGMSVSRQA